MRVQMIFILEAVEIICDDRGQVFRPDNESGCDEGVEEQFHGLYASMIASVAAERDGRFKAFLTRLTFLKFFWGFRSGHI